MVNSYEWDITLLRCYPVQQDKSNVVYNIEWIYRAKDQDGFCSEEYGQTDLPTQNLPNFIPYEDLTHSTVIDWLIERLGLSRVAELNLKLDNDILAQKSLTMTTSPPIPWQSFTLLDK